MGTDHKVSTAELKQMACPNCGKPMDFGFIAGHWFKLRWVESNRAKTIFAGNKLRRKFDSIWCAPTVEAVRCQRCKIGVFRYDY